MTNPWIETLAVMTLIVLFVNNTISFFLFFKGFFQGYEEGLLEREEEERKNGKA